jgi:hypothetical protein
VCVCMCVCVCVCVCSHSLSEKILCGADSSAITRCGFPCFPTHRPSNQTPCQDNVACVSSVSGHGEGSHVNATRVLCGSRGSAVCAVGKQFRTVVVDWWAPRRLQPPSCTVCTNVVTRVNATHAGWCTRRSGSPAPVATTLRTKHANHLLPGLPTAVWTGPDDRD